MSLASGRTSVLVQVVIVVVVAASGTFAADWFGLRFLWNASWMFALPATLGILMNAGVAKQLGMTLGLIVLSILATMATAAIFGLVY